MSEEILVRIQEARQRDVGKCVGKLDHELYAKMGLKKGDAILIKGRKKTAVKVEPGYTEDLGRRIIRIDGIARRNAEIGVDDTVELVKVEAAPAKVINLVPDRPLKIKGGEELLVSTFLGWLITQDDTLELSIMGKRIWLTVSSVSPADKKVVKITHRTRIKIGDDVAAQKPGNQGDVNVPRVIYEDIGGLCEEIEKVREMVELPLRHPELFDHLGVEAPKGVLLHGPPGTGKTLLAKAVASETNANFAFIGGPEIMSKFYGESESRLRKIFSVAEKNAPSIIFIDEIDSIAPKRDDVSGEVERRVVAQLLSLMDGLESRGKVVVIGATNRPNAIDPALRRPGRFDREIIIGTPNREGRLEVLQIHSRGMPLADNVRLQSFADIAHGYVGADLAALCKEAAMNSLKRIIPHVDLDMEEIPAKILKMIIVTKKDFEGAYRELEPSAMREVLIEKPNVRWRDIGGLLEAKQQIIESIQWPLMFSEMFAHLKVKAPKGILLYGPPGTGKTMLAKAVATETESNFISVKGPEFHSKWMGESEKKVRETFRKAKQSAPCIVFFDEIDAIAPKRGQGGAGSSQVVERVVSQLLTEMDGMEALHNIVVIAATNRPDIIDEALLRPGRFDRHIHIGTPDFGARKEIFKIHLDEKPLDPNVSIDTMAERTPFYTGADLANICNEAGMAALREYIMSIQDELDKKYAIVHELEDEEQEKMRACIKKDFFNEERLCECTIRPMHFEIAFGKVKPIRKEELEKFKEFTEKFQQNKPEEEKKDQEQ